MANQLASLPWTLDTVGDDPIFTGRLRISHFDYVGYDDASHSVEIQDKNGNTVAFLRGRDDMSTVTNYHTSWWIEGLLLPEDQSAAFDGNPNMQSGVVIVYLK